MPFTMSGTGTRYYGEREHDIGGQYITTLWIVVFGVPILPLSSWRVYSLDDGQFVDHSYFHGREVHHFEQTFEATRVPLNWRQVLNIYAITIVGVGAVVWALRRAFGGTAV